MRLSIVCVFAGLLANAGAQTLSLYPRGHRAYTADGRLNFAADYRKWIYLSSGIDMSYSPKPEMADHSMFDNVFVNPAASYREFLKTPVPGPTKR